MKMTIELPDSAKIIHVVTIIGDKRTDFTCHTEFPKEGRTIRLKENGHWEVKTMDECCGNCKYHQYEDISQGWVCCNKYSEYIADWTDYTDCCEEWESR